MGELHQLHLWCTGTGGCACGHLYWLQQEVYTCLLSQLYGSATFSSIARTASSSRQTLVSRNKRRLTRLLLLAAERVSNHD